MYITCGKYTHAVAAANYACSKYVHAAAITHAQIHTCCFSSKSHMYGANMLIQQQLHMQKCIHVTLEAYHSCSKYKQEANTSKKQIHTCYLSSKSCMLQITGSANTHMQQIMQKIMHAASALMQQSCIRPEPIMPA